MYKNFYITLLVAITAVQAAPQIKRQAVTALISSGSAPAGCMIDSTSLFGIGVHPATAVSPPGPVTQASDAQPGATSGAVTQATDAQPGAPTAVTQATDAQPGAPTAVTQASDAQPGAPTAVTQASDAQPGVPSGPVSVISDGQPQAPTATMTMMPISQIHDGQAQAYYSMPAITQIGDGQVQAPTATGVNQITDGQVQAPTGVTQITDGQVQAPTGVTQITDGQVQAPTGVTQITDGQVQAPTATGPSQISDGQPQVPTGGATQGGDGQPAASPAPSMQMVACKSNSTLELMIKNGVLFDGQGRQGYIASNYQFQFDAGAPQAGAIITAGFSLCSNGSLALGGSNIFWQCLSGTFYNLYDRDWAPQCEPVFLTALDLIQCPA